MNSEGNHSNHLTPETIRQYLEGKLDSAAMHRVEMHLLDCGFCADAVEGFELSQQSRVKTELALLSLRKKLNKKIKEHEQPGMLKWPVWSAAAAGIALAIAGYVVIKQQETHQQRQALQQSTAFLKTGVNDTLIIFLPEAPHPLNDETLAARSGQPKWANLSADIISIDSTAGQQAEVALPPADDQTRVAALSRTSRWRSAETLAAPQDNRTETLAAARAPVAGRAPAPEAARAQLTPTPEGGKEVYEKYLTDSLRYPAEALENKVEGTVTVRFTVRSSGRPAAFQVVGSLGYGCDEEAIRLIKEGPDWVSPVRKGGRPQPAEATQKVVFKLPQTQ